MTRHDLTASTCPSWGARKHFLEVMRSIVEGAPAYVLKMVPAGDAEHGITPVGDPLRFAFYHGDWWRLAGEQEDWAGPDLLAVDPVWGLRNHHSIKPLPSFQGGGRFAPGVRLIICDKNDPRRFGTFRGSTWRLEGDQ